MRALVQTGPERLELGRLPTPTPGSGEVLIRTGAVGICATDLEMLAGWDRTGYPAVPGHEWSGMVASVGAGVDPALVGMRCVGDNILEAGVEIGFERPGGYAHRFATRADHLHGIGDVPYAVATLVEPLAVCLRGLARMALADRSAALVVGDGPIGLLMVAALRRAGVGRLALLGGRAARLEVGRALGAAFTLDRHAIEDPTAAIRDCFGAAGVPNLVEASGAVAGMELALRLAAPGARLLVLGAYGEAHAGFPWNDLLHRELTLIGSNTGTGAWAEATAWLSEESVSFEPLITHRYPIERYAEALRTVRDRDSGAIKVVLEW